MCGSSGTNTTTSTSSPPAAVLQAYQNVNNAAATQAQQPTQQYSGSLQAGFTPDQLSAMSTVDNAQGAAQPYYNTGAQMIANAGQAVTPSGMMNNGQISGLLNQGTGMAASAGNTNVAGAGAPGIAAATQAASTNVGAGAVPGINQATTAAGTNIAGAGQSGINQATNAANTSPSNVSQYMSPYLQQAVGSTEAEFQNQNAQQNQILAGNAVSQGAWGGDRAGVAQGIAAGQEALSQGQTISNMENTGYQSAMTQLQQQEALQSSTGLAAAGLGQSAATTNAQLGTQTGLAAASLGQQGLTSQAALEASTGLSAAGLGQSAATSQGQLGLQGASTLLGAATGQQTAGTSAAEASGWLGENAGAQTAGLGTTSENEALAGASAQSASGQTQQAAAQEALNIPYEEFSAQQAAPYQNLSWLANIAEGTGSSSGGTGTTSSPGASLTSQLTGLATTGAGIAGMAGAFAKRGGRIHYDVGGSVDFPGGTVNVEGMVPDVSTSDIPVSNGVATEGKGPPAAPAAAAGGGGGGSSSSGSGIGSDLQSILPIVGMAAMMMMSRGGRIPRFDVGGLIGPPDVSIRNLPGVTMATHGSGPPKAPNAYQAPDTSKQNMAAMQAMAPYIKKVQSHISSEPGQPESLGQSYGNLNDSSAMAMGTVPQAPVVQTEDLPPMDGSAKGGRIRFDTGGLAGSPGYQASNPNVQGMFQKYLALPTEKLQEMSAMLPPTTPQGQMLQKALQQKQLAPATQSPSGVAAQPGGVAPMNRGGVTRFASGGTGGTATPSTSGPTQGQTNQVQNAYADYLGNTNPSAAGVAYWGGALANGMTNSELNQSFANAANSSGTGVGAPGSKISYVPTSSGSSLVPQINQNMFTQPSANVSAMTGGPAGLGTAFNPLPQYQPPGTTTTNGALHLPSYSTPMNSDVLSGLNGGPVVPYGSSSSAAAATTPVVGLPVDNSWQSYGGSGKRGGRFADGGDTSDQGIATSADALPAAVTIAQDEAQPVKVINEQGVAAQPQGHFVPGTAPTQPSPWMALANAGATMMAGRSSHPLENIGAGAAAGLREYQHEMDLDDAPVVDHSGATVTYKMHGQPLWDSGVPTETALNRQQTATNQAATTAETAKYHSQLADQANARLAQQQTQNDQTAAIQRGQLGVQQGQLALARDAQNTTAYNYEPGMGKDPATGQQVEGAYKIGDDDTREFVPGMVLTGKRAQQPDLGPVSSATGSDLMKTLPPGVQSTVQSMLDGRMPAPTGNAIKDPHVMQLIAIANQVDPNFDQTTWGARTQLRKSFSGNGQDAQTGGAAIQAINHLDELDQSLRAQKNFNLGPFSGVANKAYNTATSSSSTAVQNTAENTQAVASELGKLWRGTGQMSEKEINDWKDQVPQYSNSAVIDRFAPNTIKLMDGRFDVLQNKWQTVMGPNTPPPPLLTQATQEKYDRLGKGEGRYSSQILPLDSSGSVDRTRLRPGTVYQTSGGYQQWNGNKMVQLTSQPGLQQ